MSVAHKIEDKVRTDDVQISESIDFTGMLLSSPILDGLTKSGFKRPSPIQLQAIPLGRCGLDLIVQAKSGTGKTCVFTVIALEGLNLQTDALQVLILAPTREISIQIKEVVNSIGSCMPDLKCHSFIGGTPVQQDKISLKRCHIASGTPGRIKQLIEIGMLKTQSIRLFVLDEADKLLGGDLTETINWIYSSLPDNKQILALSATYPETLAQHLTRYMRNPTFVRLNITDPALIGIKQYHEIVPDSPLPSKVFQAKTEAVIKILSSVSFEQCLIFSNLQTRAQSLQSELQSRNWPTQCIAGCLDQKDRSLAMEHLKTYKCRILISTDLTSRGIDADKVNMVINLDVPLDHETYLHRIGRAGRFGSHGAAISIVSKGKQEKELWAVERKCKTHIPRLPDPIPIDLATRYVPLKLSDVVSTEKIITQADSLMEPSPPASVQRCLGGVEAGYKEIRENCDAHREMEEERDHKIDLDDRVEEIVENCSDQDAVSNDEIISTSADNDENLVHISKNFTEGSVAFTLHHKQFNNGTVKQCALLVDSKKHLDSETENSISSSGAHDVLLSGSGESSEICGALAYKCPECNKIQVEIGANIGNIVCPHCLGTKKETDKVMDDVALGIETDMNAKGSDKFSRSSFPVVQSFISTDTVVPGSSLDCSEKDQGGISLFGTVCPALDAHGNGETLKIGTESQYIKNSMSATHKPKKQKHPRPFALSAFLKGLTEKEEPNDFMVSNKSSDTLEKDKCLTGIELDMNDGKFDATTESKAIQAKDFKELKLCSDPVNDNNIDQLVNFVSTEPSGVSEFQRDQSKVCGAEEWTSNPCENGDKNSCQIENSVGELAHERDITPKDKSLAFGEQCLSSFSTLESCNNDRHHERDFFAFPHGSNAWKSFSELHKDFENFSFAPRKLSIKDICDCVGEQLSNLKLQSGAGKNAVGFKSDDALKVAEIKRAVLNKVARMKSERIENPDIVKDFMKIVSSCKSAGMPRDDLTMRKQPGKKKGGKKKKGNEGRSDADTSNWRNRGSDHSDWRSKKMDGDNCQKLEGTAASKHKENDFDELLREQLRLKEKKKSSDIAYKSNLSNKTAVRINSEDEDKVVGRAQSEITVTTIEPDTAVSDRSSVKEAGNFVQARSKTLSQFPSSRDDGDKASALVRAQGDPDQECQMLDQMHLEMLRKRKERKQQIAELKQRALALSSEEVVDVENTLVVNMNDKPESVLPVTNTTVDSGIIRPVENSIEVALSSSKTLGERTQLRGKEQNTNCEPASVCPLIETTVHSGIIKPVENSTENALDSSKKIDKKTQLRDEEQNLFCDIGHEQTSPQKSVLIAHSSNEILPSTSLLASQDSHQLNSGYVSPQNSTNDSSDSVYTEKMAALQERMRRSEPNVHFQVLRFNVTCLDLSSESEDLQITLSSCTDVSNISSVLSSDEASEKTCVARELKFSNESCNIASSSCSKADVKNERNVEEKDKSLKTNTKKPLGKISIAVKNIHSLNKNISHKLNKQSRNECVQSNLSNNKSMSQDFLPHRPATHTAFSSVPYLDEGGCKFEHVNMSVANNESERTKWKRNVQQHCQCTSEENDTSDETVESFDSNSSSSPNNWWPYWFFLYSHFISNSQRASNYSPFNPYHYQQQHPHQMPMGPTSWPCYHCHHHMDCHGPRLAPVIMPGYADHYRHSYYYYDQRAASFQQKYIRHMAYVMQKMSSNKYRKY